MPVQIRQSLPPSPTDGTVRVTWVGHATFLIQTSLGNILTDPVWSDRASPVPFAGPKRVTAPGIAWSALPKIAAVFLSHDHYDHCDLRTLRSLAREHDPVLIAPLGHAGLARRTGFRQHTLADWFGSVELSNGLAFTLTPARHWSNRLTGRRNGRLWAGCFIRAGGRTVHFVGDTAYDDHFFKQIRVRLGEPDIACIPIGAYNPRWFMAAQHCDPTEAVRIHQELGARRSIAMHWGTFQLTDEPREEPIEHLAVARKKAGVENGEFFAVDPGESVSI